MERLRTHPRLWSTLLGAVLLLFLGTAAASVPQVRKKIPDPEIERPFELDEEGKRVWSEFRVKCPECKGVKTAPCRHCPERGLDRCAECDRTEIATCRTCVGTAYLPDPLESLHCPYCWASGLYVCPLCNSGGQISVKDQGMVKCVGCKGEGMIPCTPCDGERLLPVLKVGGRGGPGEAKAKDLKKAREALAETLANVEAFEPEDSKSKNLKALAQALKPSRRYLPALKEAQELLETALKCLSHGASYIGYEGWVTNQYLVFKDRTIYYLKHQMLLLDLCIAHAEHNEQ